MDSLRLPGIDSLDVDYIHFPWDNEPMASYYAGMSDPADAELVDSLAWRLFPLDLPGSIIHTKERV